MTSALLAMYDELEAMAVPFTFRSRTITPTVYNLDKLPGSIQTAQLPCRILLPIGFGGAVDGSMRAGSGIVANWPIVDLFLLETMAQGSGIKDFAEPLMEYVTAYAAQITTLWNFTGPSVQINEAKITNVNFTPGPQEYPSGSGVSFYGVRVTVTVNEYF